MKYSRQPQLVASVSCPLINLMLVLSNMYVQKIFTYYLNNVISVTIIRTHNSTAEGYICIVGRQTKFTLKIKEFNGSCLRRIIAVTRLRGFVACGLRAYTIQRILFQVNFYRKKTVWRRAEKPLEALFAEQRFMHAAVYGCRNETRED